PSHFPKSQRLRISPVVINGRIGELLSTISRLSTDTLPKRSADRRIQSTTNSKSIEGRHRARFFPASVTIRSQLQKRDSLRNRRFCLGFIGAVRHRRPIQGATAAKARYLVFTCRRAAVRRPAPPVPGPHRPLSSAACRRRAVTRRSAKNGRPAP